MLYRKYNNNEPHKSQSVYIPTRERILIVDDEHGITSSFRAILTSHGHEVDAFEDPIDALCHFKQGIYALAIVDIRMPKMNGFELYIQMQKIDDDIKDAS